MNKLSPVRLSILAFALLVVLPGTATAQINQLKKAAKNAAVRETSNQVDRMVSEAIQCAFDDPRCVEEAEESGQPVVLVDGEGRIITDDDGRPITDPDEAAARAGGGPAAASPSSAKPGEGAWANYDFVPGDKVLVFEDYAKDNVGDFPRRFELIQGSFEIVEWEGTRYTRAIGSGLLAIPLPERLPEKFTVEYSVSLQHGNAYVRLLPGRNYFGRSRDYTGSVVDVEYSRAGIRNTPGGDGPESLAPIDAAVVRDAVAPVRVMADGKHMKVYLGERRVANVPNAVFPRSDTLFVAVSSATADRPILIGPIRIAGGGRDLYDRLASEGRVSTQGIYFDVNSAIIRPESTGTLKEIGTMLQAHPELRISIEGHTDSDGDDAFNLDLSERRAASVKIYLVDTFDVRPDRLEAEGFGESRPVESNDTAEGKQQNRRVELVRLGS